jgi:stage IV sporulation protein FB
MVKLRFRIHPLFLIFGIYFAFTGKVFSFLVFTFTAVIHEIGHFIASEKHGYALKRITLMPYGAIIEGNSLDIKLKDEISIALAGPLLNFMVAIIFIAIWWIFPVTYAYTDLAVFANLSIAIINLLPCYPLDGGRVILALLSLKLKRSLALKIVKILGVVISLIGVGLFICSIYIKVNFSLLFFSTFIFVGAVSKSQDGRYLKIFENLKYKKVTSPKEIKNVIISIEQPIKKLYSIISGDYYYVITVIDGDKKILLEGEELYRILSENSGYESLLNSIKKVHENS